MRYALGKHKKQKSKESLLVRKMEEFHYEEVPLAEMTLEDGVLRFPCPCGDLFELLLEDFIAGKDVAQCPTCSLTIKVLFSAEERRNFLASSGTGATCIAAA